MRARRPRASRWTTLAILVALLAGSTYAWWRAKLAVYHESAVPPTPGTGQGAPVTGEVSSPEGSTRGGATRPGGGDTRPGATPNPFLPDIQPVDLTPERGVQPRPVPMMSEGKVAVLTVDGDRLWYVSGTGKPVESFRLPQGHRWASTVVPSPGFEAVAFLTQAEAGSLYLWLVRSDLSSTPYPVPEGLKFPSIVAWGGPNAVLTGDPPYLLEPATGRWAKLPGTAVVWPGPSAPDGRRWVYTARHESGRETGYRLYVVDPKTGTARPLDVKVGSSSGVPIPGPWLDDSRFLVGMGEPTGEEPVRARALGVVDADRGTFRQFLAVDGEDTGWQPLGVSPDGRWLVLVGSAPPEGSKAGPAAGGTAAQGARAAPPGGAQPGGTGGGNGLLLDTASGHTRPFPVEKGVIGVAWSPASDRVYCVRPATGRGVELVALAVPTGVSQILAQVELAPVVVNRLLGVDEDAGLAWLDVQGDRGAPAVARWDLTAGRVHPLP